MTDNEAKDIQSEINSDSKEFSAIVKFLELTKDGKYAEIEESSLEYSRLHIESETIENEENYFYSIS